MRRTSGETVSCSRYKVVPPTAGTTQSLRFQQVRLALPQHLFCLFPLCDVFGERHYEARHALGARNEGNVVAYPDQAAVLSSVLLLDLKLLSLTFQKLGDKLPIGFSVILVR